MHAEDLYMIRYAILNDGLLDYRVAADREQLRIVAQLLLNDLMPGADLEEVLPELATAREPADVGQGERVAA